jgi:Family of unknown function (DUF6519)
MQGDFSRLTFDPRNHYSRVLMQQGRVQLDADWNEQVAILLHRFETLAADLIGPFGGPVDSGFSIGPGKISGDFTIGAGRYYVGGLLCQNDDEKATYNDQPMPPADSEKVSKPGNVIIYLDAWEQYVNAIGDPHIRETALGGPDTAGRSKVVWRVRSLSMNEVPSIKTEKEGKPPSVITNWQTIINNPLISFPPIQPPNRGLLSVNLEQPSSGNPDPCIVSPSARYRGLENQLYRVEIHTGGGAESATFKWSRENGSVIFPIARVKGSVITLQRLGADATLDLKIDDWVELDDEHHGGELFQVKLVVNLSVTVVGEPKEGTHSYLRRWDQKHGQDSKGGLKVAEKTWHTLEDGIQIRFEPSKDPTSPNTYRKGDYWCIPARTVDDGRILPSLAQPLQPDGIDHYYAPLAVAMFADGKFDSINSCLKIFDSMPWCKLRE